MSNEEREALEILKGFEPDDLVECAIYLQAMEKITNLIEKQSKEIEELKKDKLELINKNHVVHLKDVEKELRKMREVIDTKNAEIECLNVIHESYKEMVEENNFISKDKIKAKIEEVKDGTYDAKIVLQSLLEKE